MSASALPPFPRSGSGGGSQSSFFGMVPPVGKGWDQRSAPRADSHLSRRTSLQAGLPSASMWNLDALVYKHACSLLFTYRLRVLWRFWQALHFPLSEWLASERTKSALVQDWSVALDALHSQYAIPFPVVVPAAAPRRGSHAAAVDEGGRSPLAAHPSGVVRQPSGHANSLANGLVGLALGMTGMAAGQEIPPPTTPRLSISVRSGAEGEGTPNLHALEAGAAASPALVVRNESGLDAGRLPRPSAIDTGASVRPTITHHFEPGTSISVMQEAVREMQELWRHMVASRCTHWAILLATVQLDVAYLNTSFRRNEDMFQLWRRVLWDTHCPAYALLVEWVSAAPAPSTPPA
jgi:hypothetical protein